MIIKDPKVAKLFADPVRRGILHNLRHRPMSPCQLARVLEKNVSSIMYHLNALEKAGLVEQSEVKIRGNIIERYYRATAKVFVISYTLSEGLVPGSEDIAKWSKEICKRAAAGLSAFGYPIPKKDFGKWSALIEKYTVLEKKAYESVISRQVSPVNARGHHLKLLLDVLAHAELHNNPEYVELMRKISNELRRIKAESKIKGVRGEKY